VCQATWAGSLRALARGGRLVTCGSTTGVAAKTNLYMLFQQQLRLIGSFGCRIENMRTVMQKLADGHAAPVITPSFPLKALKPDWNVSSGAMCSARSS